MQRKHPDYRLVCLDALTYAGNLYTLDDARGDNFRFVLGDICDRKLVFDLCEEDIYDIKSGKDKTTVS